MSIDALVSIDDLPFAHPIVPGDQARDELKYRVHDRLVQQLDVAELSRLPAQNRRGELRLLISSLLAAEDPDLRSDVREPLIDDLLDELVGLGPLDRLLRIPGGGDILVNGPHDVWLERNGRLEPSPVRFRDDDHLLRVIERIVSRVGRRIDESSPMVDARLPDGSRVN